MVLGHNYYVFFNHPTYPPNPPPRSNKATKSLGNDGANKHNEPQTKDILRVYYT